MPFVTEPHVIIKRRSRSVFLACQLIRVTSTTKILNIMPMP